MQDLKITLVQCTQFWEDKSQNLAHFETLLEQIGDTDLILLPEMFHTGFTMNAKVLAEKMENSLAMNWLKTQVKKCNAAIYTSFIAEEDGNYFNRGVFVFPNEEFVIYDKRKLFTLAKEDESFTAGKKPVIVEYKNWKINLQICYDLRFPEISRNSVNKQNVFSYDLSLYVANWPERRVHHWKSLLVARAIENQSYVAGLNRVGKDGNEFVYSGDSNIINSLGEKLTEDFPHEERAVTLTLFKSHLDEVRKSLNFLKDA